MENSNRFRTRLFTSNRSLSPLGKIKNDDFKNNNCSIELFNKVSNSINNYIKQNKLSIDKNTSTISLFKSQLLNFEKSFSSICKSNFKSGDVKILFEILNNLKNISSSIQQNFETDKKNLLNFYKESRILYKCFGQIQNQNNNICISKSPENQITASNFLLLNQESNKSLKIKNIVQKNLFENYSGSEEKNNNFLIKNKNNSLRNKMICFKSQGNLENNLNYSDIASPGIKNIEIKQKMTNSKSNEEIKPYTNYKKAFQYKKFPLTGKYKFSDSYKKINKTTSNFEKQENSNTNLFNKKDIINQKTIITNQNNINVIKTRNFITSLQRKIMQLKIENQKLNDKLNLNQSKKFFSDGFDSTTYDASDSKKNNKKNTENLEEEMEKVNDYEKKIMILTKEKSQLLQFLTNKNNKVLQLQQVLLSQTKLIKSIKESYNINSQTSQENLDKKSNFDIKNSLNFEKNDLLKENKELNKEIQKLKEEVIKLKKIKENENKNLLTENLNSKKTMNIYEKSNTELKRSYNKESQNSIILQQQINNLEIKNKNLLEELNKTKEEYELKLKKQNEELEGLKQLIFKLQEKRVKTEDNFELHKNKIIKLENENNKLKNYFKEHNINLNDNNKEYLSDKRNNSKKKKKKEIETNSVNNKDILCQLNEAQKEITTLKNKNKLLVNELEAKEIKKSYCETLAGDKSPSNYEEEFDLKMMVLGTKNKNRSQDMDIDYPGIKQIKEKYRELDFNFSSMEEVVKKLLMNCQCTGKNMNYIKELCKMVKFDEDTTTRILANKVKKGVFSIFS